jgi:hypothetical protein
VGHLCRVDRGTRRDHVEQPSRVGIPQDRKVVNVYAMFEITIIPDDRNRRGFRIGPVLIDRQAAAVTG